MRKINFIIRSNFDQDGITEEIINELKSHFEIENGIVLDCNDANRKRDEAVEYWSVEHIGTHDYLHLHEKKAVLEPEILNEMLSYKSMAMHIMMRECHYDIYERHYLEEVYYNHLRFWLCILEEKNINCIINMTPPHHIGEYILYALAQVKGIPYVFLHPQISVKGVLSGLGISWDELGRSIEENYESKEGKLYSERDLSGYMKNAYESVKNAVIMQAGDVEKLYKENMKRSLSFISVKNILVDMLKVMYLKVFIQSSPETVLKVKRIRRRVKLRLKARKLESTMDHLEEYKKYSVKADFSKPYVYYALHLTPEASTMPQAGEYKEQLLSIEILSKLASELGFHVYVKEHWHQSHRDNGYYKKIASLPNVSLVDIKTNSIELISNSLAVSTQTGNIIFEALVKMKPAIVYSNGYLFKGAPNVIQVKTYMQLKLLMQKILNHTFVLNEHDVFRYLKAMDEEMLYSYIDSLDETSTEYDKNITAKKIVNYLIKYNVM